MGLENRPGRRVERFGFEKWPGHQPELWLGLRQEAERRAHEGKQKRIPAFAGFDQDSRVIDTARNNIRRAGLDDLVQVEVRPVTGFERQESWAEQEIGRASCRERV